ncbi:MAG: glycosyltransferase family 2 protein [Lachnospiraceae bacterium]|nr:glycosyltransferase family 2 protein [Lachnospiraceae bacterium]MDE6982365.1 glycosyltransferase family 2 protein [Lachnospiraceae bacterium]
MKKLSIMIPCYNEEENVREICAAVISMLKKDLPEYDYEILFIDNCSQDKTREYLREMCRQNPKVKAILNAKNFGQFNSPVYGMCQTTGDCTISLCCDFQDPVELVPVFVKEWEKGYKIVSGIKTSSKENRIMRFLRTCYYKMIKKMSDVEQIEHFTGFGLYDKSFIDVLRNLEDPTPFIRGIVAELGYKRKDIPYTQAKRKAGKTHNNWATLYDAAMLSFTSYTKTGLRVATIMGFILSAISIVVALVYLGLKIAYWDRFVAGTVPILLAVCIFGSAQLFFLGLLGEYVISMNKRIMNRPLVIEEERLNFESSEES